MKVSLVGAGPGDPGLITLKGVKLLAAADVIVYDALASQSLLEHAKPGAELIYVGKVASSHALPQQEINALLVARARANGGQNVVRLKGGDPYIFGRGGEEAEYLVNAGIPFEEVPGISSAIAAAAYAGIPLTHRDMASSVIIATGHENPHKKQSAHNWRALAQGGSTLVFVMGMKNLQSICDNLMANGMAADMPAAIVYRGTTPRQRVLQCSLAELAAGAEREGLTNPAVIIIGAVASLHSSLDWFSGKPLLGRRIVVTRATEQASGISAALGDLGADVIQCPAIRIEPLAEYDQIDTALAQLREYAWVIFTSVNGVRFFWQRLDHAGLDGRALAGARIAAIGPATAGALAERGIRADLVPQTYVAEDVAAGILEADGKNLAGSRILLPRAARARMILPDTLAAAGAIVDVAPLYATVPDNCRAAEVRQLLAENAVDCVAFGSSSTVENFLQMAPADLLAGKKAVLASIGPVTSATLRKYGLTADIQPQQHTIPALVDAIVAWFSADTGRN